MKIGYSQADVAKAYYDKVKPGNGYDNRKAMSDSEIRNNFKMIKFMLFGIALIIIFSTLQLIKVFYE